MTFLTLSTVCSNLVSTVNAQFEGLLGLDVEAMPSEEISSYSMPLTCSGILGLACVSVSSSMKWK